VQEKRKTAAEVDISRGRASSRAAAAADETSLCVVLLN